MRFVVIGAGAIGGVTGGRLHQAGHDVVLVARGPHHDAIRDRGLTIQCPTGEVILAVPVVDRVGRLDLDADDVVLLAVKSQDTAGVVAESTFLGSLRRTLVHTDDGHVVRIQHDADERTEYDERVGLRLRPASVLTRPRV